MFKVDLSQFQLLFNLLFAVYGVLMMENLDGATIGKKIGKIKIVSKDDCKPTMMELGLRELTKLLYFTPYIGWLIGLINCLIILFFKGNTLHDYIGHTKVIYIWNDVSLVEK